MAEQTFVYPTTSVTVDFGDGKQRELRYNLTALRKLREKFGISILSGEFLRRLDESNLPELLYAGLVEKADFADADALAEVLIPAATPYLVEQFVKAYSGSFPDSDPNAQSSQPTT